MSTIETSKISHAPEEVKVRPPDRVRSRFQNNTGFALLMMVPALIFYTLFLILPVIGTVIISFSQWSGISFETLKFNGIDNFIKMAGDPFFWSALQNSFLFVVFSLTLEIGLALVIALLLESNIRFSEWFRGVFLLPYMLSLVVIGLLFGFILDPTIGIIDNILRGIGLDGPEFGWLGTPGVNIFVVVLVHVWRGFGFAMFMIVAGLQAVPGELHEAARLEGATPWQLITRITLPLIKEVLIVVAMLTTISAMRVFDLIFVMTGGGPYHTSDTLVTYIFDLGLGTNKTQQGYATAIALILMLLIVIMSLLQLKLTRSGKDSY